MTVVISRGPVVFSVGSSTGTDEYVSETTLGTGTHSLSFTPSGDFYIRFLSRLKRLVLVESCDIESAGVMEVASPWAEADLDHIRADISGDILFCAAKNNQQYTIERRSETSWSVVKYEPEDGPFRIENVSVTTLAPAAISGNTTLTASTPIFKATNVGSIYSVTSVGQEVAVNITAQNTFTDAIRVVGIDSSRIFQINLVGNVWAGASIVTLQRSLTSETGPWVDIPTKTWTADATVTHDDGLDNQIVWYRVGVKTGDYNGADDIDADLDYPSGSIKGVCRVTGYTSTTVVDVEVLDDFGGTDASDVWAEGMWSDRRGWPSAVAFYDGRLWWFGKDTIIGSISDSFYSFDPDFEGDAGPINRTIGSGPVDTIEWGLGLQRLIIGAQMAEHSVRASGFDEPLTPTDFTRREASTQGAAAVRAIKVDQTGVYVQRAGNRVYMAKFGDDGIDYQSEDLTLLIPEIGDPGITRIAVQRKPDTRIHCVKSDGNAIVGVIDRAEEVLAWVDIETDGDIEDVIAMPRTGEDAVYYSVARTINGATVRYLEKWALETECRGGTLNKQADSFSVYSGTSTSVISGLGHLNGESVVVWADGADVGTDSDYAQTYVVSGGSITLSTPASNVVVGLPYTAQFKSAKLGSQGESVITAISNWKNVQHLTLLLAWTHAKGLRFGPTFDVLDDMPEIEDGTDVDADTVWDAYDKEAVEFPGHWVIDARLCLQAQAPRPCTVLAMAPKLEVA